MNSSTTSSGAAATATQYNNLRKDVVLRAGDYAAAGGTADVSTLSIDAQYTAYADGDIIRFKAVGTNTTTVTLNVNTLGAKTIKKFNDQNLVAGDIESGQLVTVQYDGTNFQLLSPIATQMSTANSATLTGGSTSDAQALHTHGNLSRLLAVLTTAVPVASTTTETTIITTSIPAGTLGSGNAVRARFKINQYELDNTRTMTLRLKYGSTTVASCVITSAYNPSVDLQGEVEFELLGAGATNAQRGTILLKAFTSSNQNYIMDNIILSSSGLGSGTSAEDSTGALNFVVTVQFSNSSATNQINFVSGTVEALRAA